MDLILLTKDLHEIDRVRGIDADFEIGTDDSSSESNADSKTTNTFEVDAPALDAAGLYIPGTEYGGLIENIKETSTSETVTYKGWTWRGLLDQAIVVPPTGSDYKTVSGEANSIIKSVLSGVLGGFFTVPETDSGITVKSYQFQLYTTVLDGLEDMLEENGARLYIHADKVTAAQPIKITVEAVKATTLAGTYNSDSSVGLTFKSNQMGINHLICMGQGELQKRQRIDLYLDGSGNVSQKQTFSGFQERQAYYNYSNAESEDELIKSGTERLKKLASSAGIAISSVSTNKALEIGDIVTGNLGSISVSAPITKKIMKISGGRVSISYSVKGET